MSCFTAEEILMIGCEVLATILKTHAVNKQSVQYAKSELYIKMTEVAKSHLVVEARLQNKMPKALYNELAEQAKKLEIQYGILAASWRNLNGSKENISIEELMQAYDNSFYEASILQRFKHLQLSDFKLLQYQNDLQQQHKKYMNRFYRNFEQFLSSLDYGKHLASTKEKDFKENYICAVYTVGTHFGLHRKSTVRVLANKLNVQSEIKTLSLNKVKEICVQNWKLTNVSIECESWNILLLAEALLLIPTLIDTNEHVDSQLLASLSLSKKEMKDIITFTNQLKAEAFDYTSSLLQIQKYELLNRYVSQYEKNAYKEIELANRILVVGTMSSGKSTFLNSLIGQDLFPSKNEACTAKMFEYSPTNRSLYTIKKSDSNIEESFETLTAEKLEELNEVADQASLFISGPLKSVVSINKKLTFIDTPGPNNSADSTHRDMMKEALKSDYDKILYILNGTQLGAMDDKALLQTVNEVALKNPDLPIYFIVNKVDLFDNDSNENIQTLQKNVEKYLQAQGFEDPTIFFVSSLAAKLVQNEANNQPMSRKERTQLRIFNDMMLEPVYNLAQYALHGKAPISNHLLFNNNLTENQKTLCIHSGITEVLKCL